MLKPAITGSFALALLVLPVAAQMARAPMRSARLAGFGRASERARFPQTIYLGSPFWGDDYAARYEPTPSVIVLQAPPPPAERSSTPIEEQKSGDPLLIEWQGDRYVRRNSTAATPSGASQPDYVAESKQRTEARSSETVAAYKSEPPPAIFVFRDGHREESSDYSIISGVIYARGDYWATGSWSKQIKLSQLDLPATLRANEERGVSFRLPSAPNEVVTRP